MHAMPLHKLKEFYPNYRDAFNGEDIKSLDLFTEGDRRIGSVDDVLVDDHGHFRYLVIGTELSGSGKKILLPIGLAHIDYEAGRVYVDGLSKAQVEQLPEYRDGVVVDAQHERQIRAVYSTPMGEPEVAPDRTPHGSDIYSYDQDPLLYEMDQLNHASFKVYQDRLRDRTPR